MPVLWRPLHEASGRWFWWGAQGLEPFKRLWWLMYDRFTSYHKLNNLIWVYSPGCATDLAAWYPGDQYVDIIGQDHYPMDGNNGPAKSIFDQLVSFTHGAKLVGLSENGPIPDPNQLVSENAGWLCFVSWSGRSLTQFNPKDRLAEAFRHLYVMNLEDLPDYRNYRFRRPGKAAKLGFPWRPDDFPTGGVCRRPLTVAIQDAGGATVRAGRFPVTLSIAANPGAASLGGAVTVISTNGLAVFSDLTISKPGEGYTLAAAAPDLAAALSPAFQVGPGSGILREWWTNIAGIQVEALTNSPGFQGPPTGREVLCAAVEVPCDLRTNFGERLRGWLAPPQSGLYSFQLVCDGTAELWISPDRSSENRVKVAQIVEGTPYAKWPHSHEVWSRPVALEAGGRYYLEVLHQQAAGLGQMWVSWRRPDGSAQFPVPGANFICPDLKPMAARDLPGETSPASAELLYNR